jgi:1,4-dihydroxy-2-naphthoate octaprenyltransferase
MSSSHPVAQKIRAWLELSRPPFHTVGVLPFVLGSILAWRLAGKLRWDILACGTAGVVLVMLTTYYAGEYWDRDEDSLSTALGPSRFAGGSRVLQAGLLPRHSALLASVAALLLALLGSAVLQFGYRTGPWTIPFCVLGLLGGFFYSTRPIRWVTTGVGELWIGFCYGWLPVAVGYYLQVGQIAPVVHWLAIPVGLTIINVILLNEYPDYSADSTTGKANMVVRLGRRRASLLYAALSVASWLAVLTSVRQGVPVAALGFYLPVLALSVGLVVMMLRGRWQNRETLERLCAANLLVNLGTTAAYILAFVS